MTKEQYIGLYLVMSSFKVQLLYGGQTQDCQGVTLRPETVITSKEMTVQKGSDVQLILRTIEDLTEEERQTCWEIYYGNPYSIYMKGIMKNISQVVNTALHDRKSNVIDYLRSIGVDADKLIERGWAVRKGGKTE